MLNKMPGLMLTKIYKNFLSTQKHRLEKYDLTQQQLVFMLIILNNENGIGLTELTNMLEIDKSNTTRTIQSLEKKNYIIKENTGIKEQKYTLRLTEEGSKLAEVIRHDEEKTVNDFLASLTSEEQILLEKIIEKLLNRKGE